MSIRDKVKSNLLQLRCREVEEEAPTPETDMSRKSGGYPLPPGTSEILGVEFSGVVSSLGDNVSKWKTGDEVFGLVSGVSTGRSALNFKLALTDRTHPGGIRRVCNCSRGSTLATPVRVELGRGCVRA